MIPKPLAFIEGFKDFLGASFITPEGVLLPHVATEYLVLMANKFLLEATEPVRLGLEVGFGTGVISLSLLRLFPQLVMMASDVCVYAHEVAVENALRVLGSDANRFVPLHCQKRSEVLEPFVRELERSIQVDFLIMNPPYLLHSDEISDEYRVFMPSYTLYAPNDEPLFFYERVASSVSPYLKTGGFVFAEARASRARAVKECLDKQGFQTQVFSKSNLEDLGIWHSSFEVRKRALKNHAFIVARKYI